MPNAASTPVKLRDMVIDDINWMAGPLAQKNVTKKQKLAVVFGLTAYQRRALASPFEATAQEWNANAQLSRAVCEKLSTVGDAVALVSKAAGFNGAWV